MDYENKRWISLKDGKKESPTIKKFLSKHSPEGDGAHVQVTISTGWGEEYQSFQKRTKRGSHADDIKYENHITKVPGPSTHLRRWLASHTTHSKRQRQHQWCSDKCSMSGWGVGVLWLVAYWFLWCRYSHHSQFRAFKVMSLTTEFKSDINNQLLQSGVRRLHHPKMQSVEFSLYTNKLLSWPI